MLIDASRMAHMLAVVAPLISALRRQADLGQPGLCRKPLSQGREREQERGRKERKKRKEKKWERFRGQVSAKE